MQMSMRRTDCVEPVGASFCYTLRPVVDSALVNWYRTREVNYQEELT